MKTIRVQFEVPHDKLATVTAILAGEVTNFACRDLAEIHAEKAARRIGSPDIAPKPATRVRVPFTRGGRGENRLLGVVERLFETSGAKAGDLYSYALISDALQSAGFSRTSAAPIITLLVRSGRVSRIGHGNIRILAPKSVLA